MSIWTILFVVLLIPDWPGGPGGARDWTYKVSTDEQAMLKEVMPWRGSQVTFKCEFEGKPHSYDLKVTDASLAASIEKELRENIGRSVMDIGELEVPALYLRSVCVLNSALEA